MLEERTVFVIGAGASAEIDLPVGAALRNEIVEAVDFRYDRDNHRLISGRADLLEQIRQKFNGSGWDFELAGRQISQGIHGRNSIDEFLDWHRNDPVIVNLGKSAIVRCLMAQESRANQDHFHAAQGFQLRAFDNKWYGYLFRLLNGGLNLDSANRIFENATFIVFNYDRAVEHFFYLALQSMRISADRAEEMCCRDGLFLHPYGKLAPLFGAGAVNFGEDIRSIDAAVLSENIRTFTEGDGDVVGQIRYAMATARKVVYLGFSYNETNLGLLNPGVDHEITQLFGTAHGLPHPVFEDLTVTFGRLLPQPPGRRRSEHFHDMPCAPFLNAFGDRICRRSQ